LGVHLDEQLVQHAQAGCEVARMSGSHGLADLPASLGGGADRVEELIASGDIRLPQLRGTAFTGPAASVSRD